MWVLKFLPDWIFYGILFAGVAGLVVTYFLRLIPIPFIYMYKTPIQLASIAAIVIGTFMSGAIHNEHAWLERVRELEAKVAIAEEQSKVANTQVDTKIVTKVQIVKTRGEEIIRYVEAQKGIIDATCTVPKEFVEIHNKAAEQPK